MRKLCAAKTPCTAGCKYCFSKWDSYNQEQLVEENIIDTTSVVLYPCCDGDFFMQQNMVEMVKAYTSKYKRVLVSVSSKLKPTENSIKCLYELNDWLLSTGFGMVKYASSISSKTMIEELEPGTMDYETRYELTREMKQQGVAVSLTLKPVMPFIPLEEYFGIIDKYSDLTRYVLVGGLYVDKSTAFYQTYIDNKWDVEKRQVTWLPEHPVWDYVNVSEKMDSIVQFCQKNDIHAYFSDDVLFEEMLKGSGIKV